MAEPIATTSIRRTSKKWLIDKLAPRLKADGDVPIHSGWPGRKLDLTHVWVDEVSGTVSYPFVMAGRKIRDDEFTVTIVFQAAWPGDSIDECDVRAEAIYAHLENLLADDPGLELLPGVISAGLGEVRGPHGELTGEGAVSWIFADVDVHSRLS